MNCEVCTLPGEVRVWVRPVLGGPRKALTFCCEESKQKGMRALEAKGYKEAPAVLGWDVFIPWWERVQTGGT